MLPLTCVPLALTHPLGGSLGKPLGTHEFALLFQYQPSPQPSAWLAAGETVINPIAGNDAAKTNAPATAQRRNDCFIPHLLVNLSGVVI